MLRAGLNAAFARKTTTLALLSTCVLLSVAHAGTKRSGKFSNIKIDNFGQMDERFFRGAQPEEEDFADLAGLGIQTVVDLRHDPTSYEQHSVEAAGMRYVHIPMSDTRRPNVDQIDQFMKLAKDGSTGKFFVHCAGGRHRTGVMGAVYRMNLYGWTFEQAYGEMKQYDFYTRWGHGDLKDFVRDYADTVYRVAAPAALVETSFDASTQPRTR